MSGVNAVFVTEDASAERVVVSRKQAETKDADQKKKHTPPLKNKRLRRQKMELEFLRQEVSRMEGELVRLQEMLPVHSAAATPVSPVTTQDFQEHALTQRYRPIAPRKQAKHFVWKEIAKRQFKERWRAQNQNRELRSRLEAEYELGRHMLEALQRNLKGSKPDLLMRNTDNSEVFKRQLLRTECVFIGIEKVLRGRAFANPSAAFINYFPTEEEGGSVFVMQSNVVLPFQRSLVANAIWEVLSSDKFQEYCYDHHVAHKSGSVVVQTFSTNYIADAFSSDLRCWYTLRRFLDGGRTVIVWIGLCEVTNLNGIHCHGVWGRQEGWFEFCEQTSGDNRATSTLARSQSRMTLEIDESVPDREKHLKSLFNHGRSALERISAFSASFIDHALLEKDWKMNGWIESELVPTT